MMHGPPHLNLNLGLEAGANAAIQAPAAADTPPDVLDPQQIPMPQPVDLLVQLEANPEHPVISQERPVHL